MPRWYRKFKCKTSRNIASKMSRVKHKWATPRFFDHRDISDLAIQRISKLARICRCDFRATEDLPSPYIRVCDVHPHAARWKQFVMVLCIHLDTEREREQVRTAVCSPQISTQAKKYRYRWN